MFQASVDAFSGKIFRARIRVRTLALLLPPTCLSLFKSGEVMTLSRNVKMLLTYALLAFVGVIVYRFLTEFIVLKILWLILLTFSMTLLSAYFLRFSDKIIKGNLVLNFLLLFLFFLVLCFVVIGNCLDLKVWLLPILAYIWAIPMAVLEKKKLLFIKEK